jgi:NAD(P)-dependent dehydrogenase (short-subunit alcohol dehydrogenase family)
MPAAKVLLLGATGGIGRQALLELLDRDVAVTAVVRAESRLPDEVRDHEHLTTVVKDGGALAMGVEELEEVVRGCDAVVSCLGHNPTLAGIFGQPRSLCVDTTKLVCDTIATMKPERPIKFIVVNTVGVDHPDGRTDPPRGWLERVILWLLEVLVPAHADNVKTSAYVYEQAADNVHVDFCVVRPDTLVDSERRRNTSGEGSGDSPYYSVHESLQNGLFNPAVSSRANVGRFMAELVTEEVVWQRWRGKWPQIVDVERKEDTDG